MSNSKDTNSVPDGYRALNTRELQELLQDEEKMDHIVRLNEKFQELQVDREFLLTTNRCLAEESLARRPRLTNGKLQLAEKYRELASLETACREKHSRLEANIQKHSLQTAHNLLQEDVTRAEEQSEDLLEKFMEGTVPLEGFLDSFQSFRMRYHIRRAQAEKIQELKRAKQNSSRPKKPEEREEKAQETKQTEPQRPNAYVAQGPPRVFQLRYGLTPAILLPHYPRHSAATTSPSAPTHASLAPLNSQSGQTHILSPRAPLIGHGHPVNLRVIGQLPGGWPNRPVRLQQLYRPAPHQSESPYR
ncbi:hypothetical protein DPEC_G00224330 [Dallia pectoralis]|uniref:Uncharacterized protein n=1 Tax=Dallia pectoralis TaxID=75939 RepID=A0ACC2G0B8_DALPE|nr:hypothetical protein DPEC_G00224330 [Dallia pectoralis]